MLQCYLPALVSYDFSDCCIAGLGELVNRILVVIVQASHLVAVGGAGALMGTGAGILKATAAATGVVVFSRLEEPWSGCGGWQSVLSDCIF